MHSAARLQTVKAQGSREIISVAAGLCKLCTCRSNLPGVGVERLSGERLGHSGMSSTGAWQAGWMVYPAPWKQWCTDSGVPPSTSAGGLW